MGTQPGRADTRSWRRVTCRLNLRHRWRTERTEDGGRFLRCIDCGKETDGGGSVWIGGR